jgi:hypothetical protein
VITCPLEPGLFHFLTFISQYDNRLLGVVRLQKPARRLGHTGLKLNENGIVRD